jgi:hypothetical protein
MEIAIKRMEIEVRAPRVNGAVSLEISCPPCAVENYLNGKYGTP